jgi:hypothetical protein
MKTTVLIITGWIIAVATLATTDNFQKAMGQALGELSQAKTIAEYQAVANKFMMIANADQNEWLPLYYHAQCYVMLSFGENESPAMRDEYLDVAAISVEKMVQLAPAEAEVFVMQGLLYSARLMIDPMTRGQRYSGMSAQSIGRALAIEPENPRAKYMEIANEIGTARFFGKEITQYCFRAQELFDAWDNYEVKSPLFPQWGKEEVAAIVKQCEL